MIDQRHHHLQHTDPQEGDLEVDGHLEDMQAVLVHLEVVLAADSRAADPEASVADGQEVASVDAHREAGEADAERHGVSISMSQNLYTSLT